MMDSAVNVYEEISLQDSLKLQAKDYCHAAHVMLYAEWPGALFGKYPFKYAILMQVRFDGTLGFPGGVVDQGETPDQAVSRELGEETGSAVSMESCDHVLTSYSTKTKLCLHFYAKQMSMDAFSEVEGGITRAKDWGSEVLGLTRCPLYTLPNGLGFPAFLRNNFIGNSQDQLLTSISRRGLLTPEEVQVARETSLKVNSLVCKDEINY